jgi:hypothetical protein
MKAPGVKSCETESMERGIGPAKFDESAIYQEMSSRDDRLYTRPEHAGSDLPHSLSIE